MDEEDQQTLKKLRSKKKSFSQLLNQKNLSQEELDELMAEY